MRSVPSRRSTNAALPISLNCTSRPAMATVWPSNASACARSSATVCVRGNFSTEYGSMPRARRRASLPSRWARISCSSLIGGSLADAVDAVADLAVRDVDVDRFSHALADQSLADRRLVRDPVVIRVGLYRADQRELPVFTGLFIRYRDDGAEADKVRGNLVFVQYLAELEYPP